MSSENLTFLAVPYKTRRSHHKTCRSYKLLYIAGLSLATAATSIIFVATKPLSRQNTSFVATNTRLSRKAFFCRDKHVVVAKKMILVAAPANDTGPRGRADTETDVHVILQTFAIGGRWREVGPGATFSQHMSEFC